MDVTGVLADRIKISFAIALAFGVQFALGAKLRVLEGAWVEPPWEQFNKWDPSLYRVLTFGQVPAAVDWLWMRSLQDVSYSHVPEGVHPPAYYDLDLATDLDPAYFEAYNNGANYLVVVRDDDAGARDLLLKAERFSKNDLPGYPVEFQERFWSRRWSIPMLQAYVYLFELNDLPRAAQAFREASEIKGVPYYVPSLVARLEKPLGEYDVGIRLLKHLSEMSKEPKVKEEYERQLQDLSLARGLKELEARFEEFRKKRSKPRVPIRESFERFLSENGMTNRDPLGGSLSVDESGRITTTTPYVPVFGIK